MDVLMLMRGTIIAGRDWERNPKVRLEDGTTIITLRPNNLLRKPFSIGETVLLESITRDAGKGVDFTRCYSRPHYDPAEIRTVSFGTVPWMAEEPGKSFVAAWKEGAEAAVFFDPLVLWAGMKTIARLPSLPLFVTGSSARSALNTLAFLNEPTISEARLLGQQFDQAAYQDFYCHAEKIGCRSDESYLYGRAWGAVLETYRSRNPVALLEMLKSAAWYDVILKSGLSSLVKAVFVSLPGLNKVMFASLQNNLGISGYVQIERDMAFSCMKAMNEKMAEPEAGLHSA